MGADRELESELFYCTFSVNVVVFWTLPQFATTWKLNDLAGGGDGGGLGDGAGPPPPPQPN
jgi:hypothetical protein